MSDIAKLRADFCNHFLKTGELDTVLFERLKQFVRDTTGREPVVDHRKDVRCRLREAGGQFAAAPIVAPRVEGPKPRRGRKPGTPSPMKGKKLGRYNWRNRAKSPGRYPNKIKLTPRNPDWSLDNAPRNATGHSPAIPAIVAADDDGRAL